MKKFLFFIIFFALPFSSHSQDGIFFLDLDYLLNNSEYGKKIISKLKKINDQNIKVIKDYENKLKDEDEDIKKVKIIITQEELNIKINKLKDNISIYKVKKDKIFKEYNDLKNKELEDFFTKITPYIEEFMEINSIKVIMDKKNIFIANANYDITGKLIKFLNLKIKND